MVLNRDKYDIEVRNDDTIKRNRIFFDFLQSPFNRMDGLYLHEICLLIDAIMKYQLRKHSAVEIEKLNIKKRPETKERKVNIRLLKKSLFCKKENPNKSSKK